MEMDEQSGRLLCMDSLLSTMMHGVSGIGFRTGTGISDYIGSCAMCEKAGSPSARLKDCAGCGLVRYCSKACQVKHWREHNHKQVGNEHDS
jgi:hypothetical protein